MNQDKLPFLPADILLPRDCAYSKWSVVACDQYTSQPEYWQRVEERVGSAPSTLRLILPESRLEGPDTQADITEINSTMSRYLREGRFQVHPDAVFYIERTLDGGKVRRGLVGRIDLEQYDYEPGSAAPIRATEGTVLSRIPPRVAVRKNAPIELPHVMLLADDPGRTVIEPLSGQTAEMRPLYDFDLMERGGHIRGWELTPEQWGQTARALAALADPDAFNARYRTSGLPVMLFAVGDGNHSLATAKECYERQKKLCPPEQWDSLPARYALVELNNLHDDSLEFEPIHRVVMPLARERQGFVSSDVGDVSWNCPVAQINAATMPAGVPMHSWQMVAVGKTPMAKKGMLYAAKVMAASAIDALEDPEIIRRAKEELLRRTGGKTYQPPIPAEIQPKIPRDLFQTP